MTVVEHLDEFRFRVLVALAAVMVGAIVAYILYPSIIELLKRPLDQEGTVGGVRIGDIPLFAPGITGPFMLRVKVSFFAGLLFATPVTLFQLWRFITPGLYANEKRYAIPFVASSVALFALGTWFAFLVLPTGIRFLLGFIVEGVQQPFITFPDYVNFLTLMILAFGISFEFPLVLVFLAGAGVVTSATLRRWRRGAVLTIFLIAAVATPSQDPFTQLAMAAPLYLLYEAALLVIRFGLKR